MAKIPILAIPDFSQPFVLEIDALGHGIGAMLLHNDRRLAFFNQALLPTSRLKSVYERELMVVFNAIQKWRHYLLDHKFIVRKDQRSLKFLLLQRMVSPDYHKWLCKLLGYDFDIEYKPGFANRLVDALSRVPSQSTLLSLSVPQEVHLAGLDKELQSDPLLSQIRQALSLGQPTKHGYSLIQGRLYYHNRLALPPPSKFIPLILHECHDSPTGGHSGVLKTLKRAPASLYWPGMKHQIQSYVAACPVCQQNKYSTLSLSGLLQPLSIPQQVW